jgi:catechol-2,3-dioxygenase
MPNTVGIGHITLTVTDIKKSQDFYNKVFGSQTVLEDKDQYGQFALSVGTSMMVGLRLHDSTSDNDVFDPFRVGLDHYGVHVESTDELEKWKSHLDECGAEHSGIVESPFGHHLNAKDPDKIAIEFFVPAQQG